MGYRTAMEQLIAQERQEHGFNGGGSGKQFGGIRPAISEPLSSRPIPPNSLEPNPNFSHRWKALSRVLAKAAMDDFVEPGISVRHDAAGWSWICVKNLP